MIEDLTFKAARLIYKGLSPKTSPFKDKEYKELLVHCLASNELMDALHQVAEGLCLVVVDISDKGIILSPENTDSRFAMPISDYRKELEGGGNEDKKGLIALVQVAIASSFFPTAEQLDNDDYLMNQSATVKDMNEILVGMCEKVVKHEDQELVSPYLRKSGEVVLNMPEAIPTGQRPTLKSVRGAIVIVADHLEKQGLLKFEENREGGFYFPTYRYQQILKKRSAGGLFELCQELAQQVREEN